MLNGYTIAVLSLKYSPAVNHKVEVKNEILIRFWKGEREGEQEWVLLRMENERKGGRQEGIV